jgi:hypothetical protein
MEGLKNLPKKAQTGRSFMNTVMRKFFNLSNIVENRMTEANRIQGFKNSMHRMETEIRNFTAFVPQTETGGGKTEKNTREIFFISREKINISREMKTKNGEIKKISREMEIFSREKKKSSREKKINCAENKKNAREMETTSREKIKIS